MRRRAAHARLAGLTVALALAGWSGCGGDQGGVERIKVGRGSEAAFVLRPPGSAGRPLPTVVFLHGWRSVDPDRYGPWLEHLVREGNAVIYPVYEPLGLSDPAIWLESALAGIRAALEEVEVAPRSLVVAGHSAGGALAVDYAAVAPDAGLPPARGVLSVYPGRSLRGVPFVIPEHDPARIPPDTRLLALAGAADTVVGSETARAIVQGAVRVPRTARSLETISDPRADDHRAPLRSDDAARRAFWGRLDRLIAATRGGRPPRSSGAPSTRVSSARPPLP